MSEQAINSELLLDVSVPDKLHIGGTEKKEGWKILNIQPGENVDYQGDIKDLSQFSDNSFDIVYASHVLEHVDYQKGLISAIKDIYRILRPSGKFLVSVPDLHTLSELFIDKNCNIQDKFQIMRMMFGGQVDEYDFHYVGLDDELLADALFLGGFSEVTRVGTFNIFKDSSSIQFNNRFISLNMVSIK